MLDWYDGRLSATFTSSRASAVFITTSLKATIVIRYSNRTSAFISCEDECVSGRWVAVLCRVVYLLWVVARHRPVDITGWLGHTRRVVLITCQSSCYLPSHVIENTGRNYLKARNLLIFGTQFYHRGLGAKPRQILPSLTIWLPMSTFKIGLRFDYHTQPCLIETRCRRAKAVDISDKQL